MAITRSLTRYENQDASSKKKSKICDYDGSSPPWSDLNQDVLYLVMMQLGLLDFSPFSGVCKSWRSFSLSNKSTFMASRPSMYISISSESSEEDYDYYLEDTEGRSFNSILPHSGGRICVGFTCGHLILFGSKTHDFWLLDPVMRHGFHFPDIPSEVSDDPTIIRGFVVFSPSMSGWVIVLTDGSTNIWFSIAGQGAWKHVSSTFPIVDLHAFSGKMYAIDNSQHFCRLTLTPEPKLTYLETKNFPIFSSTPKLVTMANSLYVRGYLLGGSYKSYKLDFKEMNWVLHEETTKAGAGASSHSKLKLSAAVTQGKSKLFIWKHMVQPNIV